MPRLQSFKHGLVLMALLMLVLSDSVQAQEPQPPLTPPSVTAGQALWPENCLPCHGPTGQGDGPTAQAIEGGVASLADPTMARLRTPFETFDVIKNGRIENMMPPWGNQFNDGQIWDLTAYTWQLGTSPADVAAGRDTYAQQCAACHGTDGVSTGPLAVPVNLADMQMMFARSQNDLYAAYQASNQHADLNLSEAELWQTLDYIRTFTFRVPAQNGTLRGQVINRTTGEPLGNVTVRLYAFSDTQNSVDSFTAEADADGFYTFENLSTDPMLAYMVEGNYNNVVYLSEQPATFTPDTTETTLDLGIYETTTAPDDVSISELNMLFNFIPGAVQTIQIFVLSNDGDRTYIGEDSQTFAFTLPDGAQQVDFQNDEGERFQFQATTDSYVDTSPVVPGLESHSVVMVYDLPYNGDSLTVDVPLPGDIDNVNVLLQDVGATLLSDHLEFVETRDAHGGGFRIFAGDSLSRDDASLTVTLTDLDQIEAQPLPGAAAAPPGAAVVEGVDQGLLRWMVLGGGAALIAVVVVAFLRARPPEPESEPVNDSDRERLLLTLARLDEMFEAGELDEATYRDARAKYKAELARLL